MKQGRRFGLSAAQKSEVWSRWKAGQTLHEIGRAFGKPNGCDLLARWANHLRTRDELI
jgi:hypothetical protein